MTCEPARRLTRRQRRDLERHRAASRPCDRGIERAEGPVGRDEDHEPRSLPEHPVERVQQAREPLPLSPCGVRHEELAGVLEHHEPPPFVRLRVVDEERREVLAAAVEQVIDIDDVVGGAPVLPRVGERADEVGLACPGRSVPEQQATTVGRAGAAHQRVQVRHDGRRVVRRDVEPWRRLDDLLPAPNAHAVPVVERHARGVLVARRGLGVARRERLECAARLLRGRSGCSRDEVRAPGDDPHERAVDAQNRQHVVHRDDDLGGVVLRRIGNDPVLPGEEAPVFLHGQGEEQSLAELDVGERSGEVRDEHAGGSPGSFPF